MSQIAFPQPVQALARFVVWFFAYAALGWCWEVLLYFLETGTFFNAGFLFGPMLPIYGTAAIASVLVLRPIKNPVVQFLAGALLVTVLEYMTSWALEGMFHTRWWDYSNRPFNINGRVCLYASLGFGLGMLLVCRVIQPFLERVTNRINPNIIVWLAIALLVVFLIDLIATNVHLLDLSAAFELIQTRFLGFIGALRG